MIDKEDNIVAALQHLGIETLNPMQEAALDAASSGNNVVLLSPTGSGKTLAFLLPLLTYLSLPGRMQVLILAPSRELALQIFNVFTAMSTTWKACCCYGGHPLSEEKKSIEGNHPEVIIGTPGRINDHLTRGTLQVSSIKLLVIDEFDKSLELGFQEEMQAIIDRLPALRQRMLMSATDAEEIPQFAGVDNSIRLNYLTQSDNLEGRLKLLKVISPEKDKIATLYKLLCSLGSQSTIVFCNHRDAVDRVANLLSEKKMPVGRFHGGMEQADREKSLYKFRNGSCSFLVSTDLAARGLDIPEVEHIIHYHIPVNEEAFTHRNGRTARWTARGTSYLIIYAEEVFPDYLPADMEELVLPDKLSKPAKPLWSTLYIGRGKKDKLNKIDIAGFLYKKGNLKREEVGMIDVRDHYSFVAVKREKVKQLLTLIAGEKIKGIKTLIEEAD